MLPTYWPLDAVFRLLTTTCVSAADSASYFTGPVAAVSPVSCGKYVTRRFSAPYGTSVTVSVAWLEYNGLSGGSLATRPFGCRPQDGTLRALTCSFTGVVDWMNGLVGIALVSTDTDSDGLLRFTR